MKNHVWYVCPNDCNGCQFCEGGLARCTTCGAAEGELLTHCPGYALNEEALEACYSGNVRDLTRIRSWKAHGYNIRKRTWVR